jgi:hypothetical protein
MSSSQEYLELKAMMKVYQTFSIVAPLVVVAALIFGCAPIFKSTKPADETDQAPKSVTSPERDKKDELLPDTGKKKEPSPISPRPKYEPPPPPAGKKAPTGAIDLRKKEDINASALKFAKNIKGVKHVKTCYSKLYGGWYLLLYVEKKKRIALQQYVWNEKSKEWEVIYYRKEIPPDTLDFHLKGEVADEKCFLLK